MHAVAKAWAATRAMPPREWLIRAVFVLAAIGLSMQRVVIAPGFELYFGPFFYLIAMRIWGLRLASLTLLCVMAPTLGWWGHPYSVLLAIGQIFVIQAIRRGRDGPVSVITLIYFLTIGLAVGMAVMLIAYGTSIEFALIQCLRKLLTEMLLAGAADMAILAIAIRRPFGRIDRISLSETVSVATTLMVSVCLALYFFSQALNFSSDLMRERALLIESISNAQVNKHDGAAVSGPRYFAAASAARARSLALQSGQCTLFEDMQADAPNDQRTFAFWDKGCFVSRLTVPHTDAFVAVPVRETARAIVRRTLWGAVPLFALLAATQCLLIFFRRTLARALAQWRATVDRFGSEALEVPHDIAFTEFQQALKAFASANNAYAQSIHEREQSRRMLAKLQSEVDLQMLCDVGYDWTHNVLRFTVIDPQNGPRSGSMAIHALDRDIFIGLIGRDPVMFEFRGGTDRTDDWHMLLAQDFDTEIQQWKSACIIRLRTAKAVRSKIQHNSRLMDLGGMASALGHELRQPIFTISLAAENGMMLLDDAELCRDDIRAKFTRIIEQVGRAQSIIQRTSHYAREHDADEVTLVRAIDNAVQFMRPLLEEHRIDIHVAQEDGVPDILVQKVGFEQIVVNALRNATDAIDQMRTTEPDAMAHIAIGTIVDGDDLLVRIADNGAGIDAQIAEEAFDAFATTKPANKGTGLGLFVCRQIIQEMGGSITLGPNRLERHGAILTVRLPLPAATQQRRNLSR